MADAGSRRSHHRRKNRGLRGTWCCSGVAPQSPESRNGSAARRNHHRHQQRAKPQKAAYAASFQSSPSPSGSKMGLGLIDPRRILSPERVSPIDSEAALGALPETGDGVSVTAGNVESGTEYMDAVPKEKAPVRARLSSASSAAGEGMSEVRGKERSMDLRLSLKGMDGKCFVLELDSGLLCRDSQFFAAMVSDARRKASDAAAECRKIEVAEIEDLSVFKDTIELMYEKDIMKSLVKAGVHRCIDILEVSACFGLWSCHRELVFVRYFMIRYLDF